MAEKLVPGKRKRYRFLLSSFSSDEKAQLANSIRTLGGTYIDSPQFVGSCTHVICGKPNRGEKFLCGCASGKWILRGSFIQDSVKANKWMDEEAYEWTEQCEEVLPSAHLSAPSRWRKFLQVKGAPYKGWKAIVVVGDAKRRNAYKRLLEVGGAKLVNSKPPFSGSLAEKLTHAFVESTLAKDVQSLKEHGIPCLSTDYIPEFILQEPSPAADLFSISTYAVAEHCKDTNLTKKGSKNFTSVTPVLSLRSISVTEVKIKGEKKDDASSPVKQMKKAAVRVEPKRVNISPPGLLFPQGMQVAKMRKSPFQFPSYVTDTVEGCLEENHVMSALSTMTSYLSHQRYPTPALLHTIMDDLLLKSSSPTQANKANLLLHRLLVMHPPDTNTALYRSALCSAKLHQGQVQLGSTEWEFVKKIVRLSLDEPMEPEDAAYLNCSGINSMLLLKFLQVLFERDFYVHRDNKNFGCSAAAVYRYRETLLWQMFWPRGSAVTFNRPIREMIKVTWSAITCTREKPAKIQVVHALQSILSLVAECCSVADGVSSSVVGLGEITRTLVTELSLVCSGTHRHEEDVRLLLETLRPDWFRMHLADSLLRNYDHAVVPDENKYLLNRPLSFKKIVQFYFFLLPRERVGNDKTQTTCTTRGLETVHKGKKRCASPLKLIGDANHPDGFDNILRDEYRQAKRPKRAGVNRRNVKGETQLHVACIKNDVSRVQQLLSNGADVNLIDYAGWTPLHEASNHGHVTCVKEILWARPLAYGSDETKDENLNILAAPLDGTTPLHDAVANNHLQVAELLVSHGGLPTLEAKNASELKPLDFAVDSKMKEFLKTAELNLRNNLADVIIDNSNSAQMSKDTAALCPSEDAYQVALGRKRRCASGHVPPEKCEEYLLILSQLVQCFTRQNTAASDLKQGRQLMDLTESLELHIERIIAQGAITPLCRLRLQGIKFFARA